MVSTVLNKSWACGRERLACAAQCTLLYAESCSALPSPQLGSLLGPIRCPVQHNYSSVCIFFHLKLVKYGEHQSTFYTVKRRVCCVGTQGQQEGVLGVLKLAGLVMGNCWWVCGIQTWSGLVCAATEIGPWCEYPRPHWGIAGLFKKLTLIKWQSSLCLVVLECASLED